MGQRFRLISTVSVFHTISCWLEHNSWLPFLPSYDPESQGLALSESQWSVTELAVKLCPVIVLTLLKQNSKFLSWGVLSVENFWRDYEIGTKQCKSLHCKLPLKVTSWSSAFSSSFLAAFADGTVNSPLSCQLQPVPATPPQLPGRQCHRLRLTLRAAAADCVLQEPSSWDRGRVQCLCQWRLGNASVSTRSSFPWPRDRRAAVLSS